MHISGKRTTTHCDITAITCDEKGIEKDEVHIGECLDMASFNFHGLNCDKFIAQECENGMRKYGVGACGPRGFYGTYDGTCDHTSPV